MKESTEQLLLLTLNPNHTFYRWAFTWDGEHVALTLRDHPCRNLSFRAVLISRIFVAKITKALYQNEDYSCDPLLFALQSFLYWILSRFFFTVTGKMKGLSFFVPFENSRVASHL